MTTTLSEGVKVPDVGSVNWAGDLEVNWNLLNGALANLSGNVKTDRDNTWTGEQSFTLPIVGSITGTASKAIADEDGTSIKTGYVNVAGNQTVSGDKSFTGSNTFNSILPNATNTYSLGSSSYQWSSVYAQTYYYNGTAWGLDKANVWTQSQTIKNTDYQIGEIPSAAKARYINFTDKNSVNIGWVQRRIESSGDSSIELFVYNRFTNSQPDTAGTLDYAMLKVGLKSNQTHFCEIMGDTYPRNSNTYNLGTSTNKWKTLNGINPGALSLPNVNAVTGSGNTQLQDISGDLVQDQYFNCYFTPRMDGWAYIALNCSSATIRSGNSSFSVMAKTAGVFANALYTQSFTKTESAWSNLVILFPVTANKEITLECTFTGFSVTKGYVIPCLGNV